MYAVGPTTVFETLLSDHRCPLSTFFNDTIMCGDKAENLKKVRRVKPNPTNPLIMKN
jgi:hypothetical protein